MNKILVCVFLAIAFCMANAMPADEEFTLKIKGGVRNLEGEDLKDAEKTLKDSLAAVKAGDGPNYELVEIHSATKQVVSGSKYKIVADLIDTTKKVKKCNVTIWSQPWLENGIEVTFECEGEEAVVKKHSA